MKLSTTYTTVLNLTVAFRLYQYFPTQSTLKLCFPMIYIYKDQWFFFYFRKMFYLFFEFSIKQTGNPTYRLQCERCINLKYRPQVYLTKPYACVDVELVDKQRGAFCNCYWPSFDFSVI